MWYKMLVKNPEIYENNAFSVEHSEATVRDIDMNLYALEYWGLWLFNAQNFVAVRCTPASLNLDEWSH